jgi:hypothetical protein
MQTASPLVRETGCMEGQRPSSAEEEAKSDDETKAVRGSAQFETRPNPRPEKDG